MPLQNSYSKPLPGPRVEWMVPGSILIPELRIFSPWSLVGLGSSMHTEAQTVSELQHDEEKFLPEEEASFKFHRPLPPPQTL